MSLQSFVRLAIEHWVLSLIALFFFFPFLTRFFDLIAGKPKRENELREIANQRDDLITRLEQLSSQKEILDRHFAEKEAVIASRESRLNDCVREHTVQLAKNVASRSYLQETPAFREILTDNEAFQGRLNTVLNSKMHIVPPFDISANIVSESNHTYQTTLYSCTCPDFIHRKSPCKHMIRIAVECGLLFNYRSTEAEKQIAELTNQRDAIKSEIGKLQIEKEQIEESKQAFMRLLEEKKQTYPWLAQLYSDLLKTYDDELVHYLRTKAHSAEKASTKIAETNKELASWRVKAKEFEYQLAVYESAFPWLLDFKSLPPIEAYDYAVLTDSDNTDDSKMLRTWLSLEEFHSLPLTEQYQLALDRYVQRKNKSNWEIGIEYERYIGYLSEGKGYSVTYNGAVKKLEDMGRDLILEKDSKIVLIQCKRWSAQKTIHENHIFQLAGSVFEYQYSHPGIEVQGVFVTTTSLSPIAAICAHRLDIQLFENIPFKEYPRIKCNIGKDEFGRDIKIYHLPMDQQYNSVKIDRPGEFYAWTVQEAEAAGFRRAYRWHGGKET
ncbi:restriction endonuclease [Oscillibacter valericigenes]|nr:restriction endonuclease [Oscillibacter valericigenes]